MDLEKSLIMPFKAINNLFTPNELILETKVNNPSYPMGLPLYPTGDKPILYAPEAILYFQECAPVQTAIDKITSEVSAIKVLAYNKKTCEFISDHPVLDLLSFPDADFTYQEFIQQLANFYLITGNTYIKAEGYIEQPPLDLRVMPPQAISIIVGYDGYAQNMTARVMSLVYTYNRTKVKSNGQERFRYYANDFNELYQIRTFNPMVNANMGYGLSPLNAIFYEMRQYIEAAKFNLSSLQRGMRLSGIIKSKSNALIPDKRKQEYMEQLNYGYAGSNNAGRIAFLENDFDFIDTMKNGRDMDYVEMRNQVTMSIYNALKIPLPLISPDHSTMANLEASRLMLYDNAVIPLTKRLLAELTNFLMPRYKNSEDIILAFNEKDIPALEPRRNEQAQIKSKLNIFTKNEIRKDYGVEPLSGGNQVYEPSNNLPVATDLEDPLGIALSEPDQSPKQPLQGQDEGSVKPTENIQSDDDGEGVHDGAKEPDDNKATRDKFINTLKLQVNRDGAARFTDEEINKLADKYYA